MTFQSTSFNNHWIIQGQVTVTVRSNSCQMIHLDSTMGNQPGMISTFDPWYKFFSSQAWCPRYKALLVSKFKVALGAAAWRRFVRWFLGDAWGGSRLELLMISGVFRFTNGTSTMTGESSIGKMLFFFFLGFLGWVVAEYLKGNLLKDTNFWSGNDRILAMKW